MACETGRFAKNVNRTFVKITKMKYDVCVITNKLTEGKNNEEIQKR